MKDLKEILMFKGAVSAPLNVFMGLVAWFSILAVAGGIYKLITQ